VQRKDIGKWQGGVFRINQTAYVVNKYGETIPVTVRKQIDKLTKGLK